MKVLILYAKIGSGHLKAAEAIKEILEKNYNDITIVFKDGMEASKEKSISNKFIIKSYLNITKYTPDIWGNIYNSSDKMDKTALKEMYDIINKTTIVRLKKIFKEEEPDIIISTHPFVTKMVAYLKEKRKIDTKFVTVVTDYGIHAMWIDEFKYIDKIFVATEKMKLDAINCGVDNEKIEVTGIPISGKFNIKHEKSNVLKNLNLDQNKKTFLFFAGGGLGVGKSKGIFKELLKEASDIQIIVVAGKNKKQKLIFDKIARRYNHNVKILGYVENVPELMSASDLVITKPGGLTSTECMIMKKPMIIINPIPGQEEMNAEYFTNNGAALWVHDKRQLKDMLYIIKNNPLRLKQMEEMCKELSTPYAADKIVTSIYKLVEGE